LRSCFDPRPSDSARANYGKLRFGTEYEQHLWSECSRLIANCIIYYNATLLSHLLAYKESRGGMQGAALVKQASFADWIFAAYFASQ
jgi:hypothetical protein